MFGRQRKGVPAGLTPFFVEGREFSMDFEQHRSITIKRTEFLR